MAELHKCSIHFKYLDVFLTCVHVRSDGSELKPLYKETPLDWVTHETFATEDYVYFNVLGFQSGHFSDGQRLNLIMVDLKKVTGGK